mgnify:CR=1 FL=1
MKLKERLRIAWQVLTKGTCKGFDRELLRNRLSLTYNYEAIYHPEDELWISDVDRMACKYFAEQIFQSRVVSVDGEYRYDKPVPIRMFYQIDVLMPEK